MWHAVLEELDHHVRFGCFAAQVGQRQALPLCFRVTAVNPSAAAAAAAAAAAVAARFAPLRGILCYCCCDSNAQKGTCANAISKCNCGATGRGATGRCKLPDYCWTSGRRGDRLWSLARVQDVAGDEETACGLSPAELSGSGQRQSHTRAEQHEHTCEPQYQE